MSIVAEVIHRIIQLLVIIVIIQTVLTYFMSPFDPIRRKIDRFVEPVLSPIRRLVPPIGGLDFSPFILIIVLQILDAVIIRIFRSL